MTPSLLLIALLVLMAVAYVAGRGRSVAVAQQVGGIRFLNSLPFYYGTLTALWCLIPSAVLLGVWVAFDGSLIRVLVLGGLPESTLAAAGDKTGLLLNQIQNIAQGTLQETDPALLAASQKWLQFETISRFAMTVLVLSVAVLGAFLVWLRIASTFKARLQVEIIFRRILFVCASIAVLTTVGIVVSVLFEALMFFRKVPVFDFLFGLEWSPQTAIRADQQGSSGSFGAVPLFTGTLLIAGIAMIIAVPCGLMTAIYLSEYASRSLRDIIKPLLEVLAGVPTVVYGFFAALTVAPFIRDLGVDIGLDAYFPISSESALAAGIVMGVMIIPFVSSLSDDVINAVPQSLRDGALGLGSTRSEVVKQVVIPAALPGIVGSILLAVSRAIGETMIVVMAAGMAANLSANPFDSVTTVTVQIVTLLVGDQEFDSPKTLAAFALGLMLFLITLALNYFALHIVKKYREQYE
jgi:phosphate transport system permease protein